MINIYIALMFLTVGWVCYAFESLETAITSSLLCLVAVAFHFIHEKTQKK